VKELRIEIPLYGLREASPVRNVFVAFWPLVGMPMHLDTQGIYVKFVLDCKFPHCLVHQTMLVMSIFAPIVVGNNSLHTFL
jgi:hypothetical protein